MINSVAHIEINVSDITISKSFYTKILAPLGWKQFDLNDKDIVGYKALDSTHLFLVQTERGYTNNQFHRKNIGLNHIAFRVETIEQVDQYAAFLETESIKKLYHEQPKDYSSEYATEHYYAIFFEDPDRIKLEIVFVK